MALARPSMQSLVLPVHELSQIGEARRQIVSLAHRIAFDEPTRGRLALLVTEAGANMVRHARQGQLVVRTLEGEGQTGLEVLALDKGPGMADVRKCMQDGYSTGGTSGTGLGALQRLADVFDIYSEPNAGTALLMQVRPDKPASSKLPDIGVGVVCAPHSGEAVCGDAWAIRREGSRLDVLVADGLGHGELAAEPAREAVRLFEEGRLPARDLLPKIHASLRRTRGAAVAISEVDLREMAVQFWCVGNVSGVIVHGESQQQMTGQYGTAGRDVPTLRAFRYELPRGAALAMYSDGLTSRWRLSDGGLLRRHHPSLLAGMLYRDHRRGRDDVTIVIVRLPPS